jgi:hypothetical protein
VKKKKIRAGFDMSDRTIPLSDLVEIISLPVAMFYLQNHSADFV